MTSTANDLTLNQVSLKIANAVITPDDVRQATLRKIAQLNNTADAKGKKLFVLYGLRDRATGAFLLDGRGGLKVWRSKGHATQASNSKLRYNNYEIVPFAATEILFSV